jgi:serine/threonine protein kinase
MSDAAQPMMGPYQPKTLLAIGSQAQVWVASGPSGDVALKVARTDAHRQALRREATLHQAASHPGLVRMIDVAADHAWMALELVDGPTLDVWAQRAPIEALIDLALELLDALEHLHGRGVVHGDIKPANVVVDSDDHPRLLDLGVAVAEGTRLDGFRGTLGFAAPELLRGDPPTRATDLYGLGALLYSCITGRTPFVAPDPAALTYLPLVSLPAPPAAFEPDIPSGLNQLLLALLARDPSRRPSSIDRVRDALRQAASTKPPPPLLGMTDEREDLRRAVVGAADGEPRVVVIYGPPGCGRRTLIAEAVEYARREGLPYLKGSDPRAVIQALRDSRQPSVLVTRAGAKSGRQLAELVLKESLPCLVLLHAERPLPSLAAEGAILLTPSPFTERDAVRLARMFGVEGDEVGPWWRQTMGLPAALLGKIRAWRRERGLTEASGSTLSAESQRVLDALRAHPTRRAPVPALAAELEMTEHLLLDHCEALFAEGLVEALLDGESIGVVAGRA